MTFFPEYKAFLFQPRVFSHALGCGARRAPACTPRCKGGSRPGPAASVLGAQSRAIWQVTTGLLSSELEPNKTMEKPQITCFPPLLHKGPHGNNSRF